jgi:uracil-DNA glycosylase
MTTLQNTLTKLPKSWQQAVGQEFSKKYMKDLWRFLDEERKSSSLIYPSSENMFNAFFQTPFDKVKVVIIGQDPYHGPNQAHGLSFSVLKGIKPPRSLMNIYKELYRDLKIPIATHGELSDWAKQGVLLLNATLTVREKLPKSHYGMGWEIFTDAVVRALLKRKKPCVFLLWGKLAQSKCENILNNVDDHNCHVLCAAHPSPFSANRGFFGCNHFSLTNNLLKKLEESPISWEIDS